MSYSGIHIILNRLSRFDKNEALSRFSNSGEWFFKQSAKYGLNRENFQIDTLMGFQAKQHKIHPDTKVILALGDDSHRFFKDTTTLNENRGSPYYYGNIPVISSFAPQDTHDVFNYEDDFHSDGEGEDDTDKDKTFGKSHGATSRKNYRFWLKKDLIKCIKISRNGLQSDREPEYCTFPTTDELCEIVKKFKGCYFHIDIETDVDTLDITCFSFTYEDPTTNLLLCPIYIVPLRRYNYTCSYSNPGKILQQIAIAMRDNITVTHNGHQFDLFVFAYKYRIAWGERQWDTMVSHNRLFPEIEKSLGHCMSLYTDLPFHKNEGIYAPKYKEQEAQLWKYCGKDVFGMYRVRVEQQRYAELIRATDSIEWANSYIPAYLTITFTGIRRDKEAAEALIYENQRRINQLQRILNILVGRELNPGSYKQMRIYLYNKRSEGGLGLDPQGFTDKGDPGTGEQDLLKLHIKYNLASLSIVLEMRKLRTETSSLDIEHWNPYGKNDKSTLKDCVTGEIIQVPETEVIETKHTQIVEYSAI